MGVVLAVWSGVTRFMADSRPQNCLTGVTVTRQYTCGMAPFVGTKTRE
jgi:hypothetical protein